MNEFVMDKLQYAFEAFYGFWPRRLKRAAVEPILVGHRGVCGHPLYRENTMDAFDFAVGWGGGLEMDLHLTRDNVPVIHHDSTLLRVHGVRGAIRELDFETVRKIAPAVPTLDEVLERFGERCPHYFLEPKVYSSPERVERLTLEIAKSLDKYELRDHATIISLDPRPLDCARRIMPKQPKVYVFGVSNKAAVDYAVKHQDTGLAGWHFNFPLGLRRFLADRGLHEGVGHIDHLHTGYECSNLGFRYQFTNRIDRLAGGQHRN